MSPSPVYLDAPFRGLSCPHGMSRVIRTATTIRSFCSIRICGYFSYINEVVLAFVVACSFKVLCMPSYTFEQIKYVAWNVFRHPVTTAKAAYYLLRDPEVRRVLYNYFGGTPDFPSNRYIPGGYIEPALPLNQPGTGSKRRREEQVELGSDPSERYPKYHNAMVDIKMEDSETLPDFPSNVFARAARPDSRAAKTVRSQEFLSRAGVEETYVGSKGYRARANRQAEEANQRRLLKQAVAFGQGDPAIGFDDYNVPERIQKYIFDTSCSFSVGWNRGSPETSASGRAGWSVQAPIWQGGISYLRANLSNAYDGKSRSSGVGIWEANATWTMRNNLPFPAEITVWRLDPKYSIPCEPDTKQVGQWFLRDIGGASIDQLAMGIWKYQSQNAANVNIPAFDQTVAVGPPYNLRTTMCRAMNNSYGDTTKLSRDMGPSEVVPSADYYYNSPYDFKCWTENFHITPVYHRWVCTGDTSILKASIPYSVMCAFGAQSGRQDPNPTDATENIPDEKFYAWKKTWGPLFLFRIRGDICFDETDAAAMAAEAKSKPTQKINFASALVDVVSHYEWHCNLVPIPEPRFNFATAVTQPLNVQDQILFADERMQGADLERYRADL